MSLASQLPTELLRMGEQAENNKGVDQTAHPCVGPSQQFFSHVGMDRLACGFAVHILQKEVFSPSGSFNDS